MRRPAKASATTSCETAYPTMQQLFSLASTGPTSRPGYGAGPGCSGLTPSQENSLYGAPNLGPRAKGKGVDIAVFELSAYQHSDIATWAHQFYGPGYNPPLVDVNVDGGPLNPQCPVGDTVPAANSTVTPATSRWTPTSRRSWPSRPTSATSSSTTRRTTSPARPSSTSGPRSPRPTWPTRSARAGPSARTTSPPATPRPRTPSSGRWPRRVRACSGPKVTPAPSRCLRSDGHTNVNLLDPPAQPWVTSVGGTSFENFNPGTNPHPRYPRVGEAVWNVSFFYLSAYQHSYIHLGAPVLRAELHPAAGRREHRRRSAEPAVPGRRPVPAVHSRVTPATSRSTRTSRRSWPSRPTSATSSSTTRRTTSPARPSSTSGPRSPRPTWPTRSAPAGPSARTTSGAAYAQAENTIFRQMAAQGQSRVRRPTATPAPSAASAPTAPPSSTSSTRPPSRG